MYKHKCRRFDGIFIVFISTSKFINPMSKWTRIFSKLFSGLFSPRVDESTIQTKEKNWSNSFGWTCSCYIILFYLFNCLLLFLVYSIVVRFFLLLFVIFMKTNCFSFPFDIVVAFMIQELSNYLLLFNRLLPIFQFQFHIDHIHWWEQTKKN